MRCNTKTLKSSQQKFKNFLRQMPEDRVRVRLRAHLLNEFIRDKALPRGKYFLAVSGPGLQLGFEDFDKAPRMTTTGHDVTVWTKDLWILKNSVLSYKYLIIQRYTNEVLHCENIAKREVNVTTEPIIIDDTYNRVNTRGNNKYATKTSTRPNAYGQNTRMFQTKVNNKTIRSQDKEKTKVGNSKQYQKQDAHCDQKRKKSNDGNVPARNEAKHKIRVEVIPVLDITHEKEKKNGINDKEATQPFPIEKQNMVQMESGMTNVDGEVKIDIESNTDERYVHCMKAAGKIGLFAVAAFGVYKLITRKFL